MKLWLLKRTDTVDYDEFDAVIVRAETEEQARLLAPNYGWSSNEHVKCTELTVDGKAGLILGSFNAG